MEKQFTPEQAKALTAMEEALKARQVKEEIETAEPAVDLTQEATVAKKIEIKAETEGKKSDKFFSPEEKKELLEGIGKSQKEIDEYLDSSGKIGPENKIKTEATPETAEVLSKTEQEKEHKPSEKTEEKEKVEEGKESKLELDLEVKRNAYLHIEKELKQVEKTYKTVLGLQGSKIGVSKPKVVENYERLKGIKDAYEASSIKYGQSLLGQKEAELSGQKDLSPEKRKELIKEYAFEVFKKITFDENEKLNQERIRLLSQREKGIFGKAFNKWQKMPNTQKWAIAAAAATGVAFVGGGAAIPAMTYFGYRLGRAALGTIAGRLAGGAYEKLIIKRGREKTTQRIKTEAVKEISGADNLEKIIEAVKSQSGAAREKISKQAKKEKWQRVGQAAVIAGTAGLASWGAGKMFDNIWGTAGGGAPSQPEKITGKTSLPAGETPEMPGGKALPLGVQPSPETAVLSQEAAAVPEAVPEFEDTVIVQKGDSVWKILEKQAGARGLFDGLEGSPEEIATKKTYIIDALKRQASETLGLKNPDLIQPGQSLNIGGLFENKDRLVEVFNKAQNLTPEQIENISNYGKGAKVAAENLTDAKNLTDNVIQTSEIKVAIPSENFTPTELTPDQPPKAPYIEAEKSWDELSPEKQETIKQVAGDNLKRLETADNYLKGLGFDGLSDRSYVAVKNSSLNDLLYQFRDIPNLADENKILEAYKNFPEKYKLPGSGVFGTYTQLDFFNHAKLANWVRMNLEANPSFVNRLKNGTIDSFLRWTAE
ncbi:hypothetical protein KJ853_03565 [Patescibacteria group bacterium]|nr:hypothetical protein [Patescibacteria group bacterium]